MKKILAFLFIAAIGWFVVDKAIDALQRSSAIFDTHVTVVASDGSKLHVIIKREEVEDSNHSYTHLRYLHSLSYQASDTDPLEQIGQMHGSEKVDYCVKRWSKLRIISHPNFACEDQRVQGYMGDSSWSVSETYPAVFVRTPDGIWRNWLLTVPKKSSLARNVDNGTSQGHEKNGQEPNRQNTVFSYTHLPDDVVQKIWRALDDSSYEAKPSVFDRPYEEMNFIANDDEKHQLVFSHQEKPLGYERWFYFKVEADGSVTLAPVKLQGIACQSPARARRCSADSLTEFYPLRVDTPTKGDTPLHRACRGSYQDKLSIDTLIEQRADPTAINSEGLHPLDICLHANTEETKKLVEYILTRNDAAQSVHRRNGSLLHVICKIGGLHEMKEALKQTLDLAERDFEGNLAIQNCLARRSEKSEAVEMIDALLSREMPKGEQYKDYQHRLWEEVCNFRDAKLTIMLKTRKIALPNDVELQRKLIRRCLDDKGSDATSVQLIPELVAAGFDFNIPCCRDLNNKNFHRESILHIASRESRMPAITEILIGAGANVLAKDKEGLLPFDVCEQTRCDARKMFAIVRAMTSKLRDIDSIRISGDETMLYSLVKMDELYVDSIKLLIDHGANPDFQVKTRSGYISTPRNMAAFRNPRSEIVLALERAARSPR